MKKNEHSYFTTDIEQVVLLKRLDSSKKLSISVHNIEEHESIGFTFLDQLVKAAKTYNIEVDVKFEKVGYFKQYPGTTVVFNDAIEKEDVFNLENFQNKLKILHEFFIYRIFGTSSDVMA